MKAFDDAAAKTRENSALVSAYEIGQTHRGEHLLIDLTHLKTPEMTDH